MTVELPKYRIETGSLAAVAVAAGLFFAFTSPRTLSSPFLVAGFVLLFAITYLSLRILLRATGLMSRLPRPGVSIATWGLSSLVIIFLALQSIGQLTLRDVVTVLALFLTVCFYLLRVGRRG